MKTLAPIVLILLVFGVLKLYAPDIASNTPEWLGGLIILIVAVFLIYRFFNVLFRDRD